jgi:heat shock protein HslJ
MIDPITTARRYGVSFGRLALVALAAGACSAPTEADGSQARAEGPATVSSEAGRPSLYGNWRIVEVNGRPAQAGGGEPPSQPEVGFSHGGYGGSSGCNGFGGVGMLVGDRWFAEGPMATQMACGGEIGPQEDAVFTILSGGPKVTLEGPDSAVLRTAGTGVETRFRSGQTFDLMAETGGAPPRLTMGPGDRFSLALPCGTMHGRWRSERTP